jgi:hypothetical protein
LAVSLPARDDKIEIAGVQYLLGLEFAKSFVKSFIGRLPQGLTLERWFESVIEGFPEAKRYAYTSPFDARFLLIEAKKKNSSLNQILPEVDSNWISNAKPLIGHLNSWSHQGVEPTLDSLLDLSYPMLEISKLSNLDILSPLEKLISRVRAIKNGTFTQPDVPTEPSVPDLPPEGQEYVRGVRDKLKEMEHRPPLGGKWSGSEPTRVLRISRAEHDLTENGVSIRQELGPDADKKIADFLRYYPSGGKVMAAADGAIRGFYKGDALLIGWLAGDPFESADSIRGFRLDFDYVFTGEDIVESGSQARLSVVAEESIEELIQALKTWGLPSESPLMLTTYGDLVLMPEDDEPRKITKVHAGIWFPGHLVQRSSKITDYGS